VRKGAAVLKLKRAGILTKLIIVALALYAVVTLISVRDRAQEAEATRAELATEQAALTQKNAELEYQIEHSEDDETIEEIARDKLGLVLPGEKIFYDISD